MQMKKMKVAGAALFLCGLGASAFAAGKPEDLVKAAGKGDLPKVRALLAEGVPVNTQDKDGHTALLRAALEGKTDVVRALLDATADPNLADKDGKTPLWEASRHGKADAVELLLRHDARLDLADKSGDTPLFQGARKGNERVVELLLAADSAGRARFRDDPRLLMAAAEGGNGAVVRQVLALGGEVDATGSDGETALFRAARGGNGSAIEALVEAHANVNGLPSHHLTPLMAAAEAGKPEAVRALLRAGAQPDLRNQDDKDWTAIMYAAKGSSSAVIDELADGGAAVNAEDETHDLPIHIAARYSNGSVVHALLAHNSAVNRRSGYDRKTPLEIAVEANDRDVAAQLIDGGGCVTPAMRDHAAKRNDEKMIALLSGEPHCGKQ
jgi:ankyrin repeat protein